MIKHELFSNGYSSGMGQLLFSSDRGTRHKTNLILSQLNVFLYVHKDGAIGCILLRFFHTFLLILSGTLFSFQSEYLYPNSYQKKIQGKNIFSGYFSQNHT